MRCPEARERMLEAELDALRGVGDGPLAHHVRTCGRCGVAAEGILRDTEALAGALATAPRRSAEEALAEHRRARGKRDARWSGGRPDTGSRGRRLVWPVAAGLAAASLAALSLLELGDGFGDGRRPGGPPAVAEAVPSEAPPPTVETAPGNRAAVFATGNPDITLVWIYDEETE